MPVTSLSPHSPLYERPGIRALLIAATVAGLALAGTAAGAGEQPTMDHAARAGQADESAPAAGNRHHGQQMRMGHMRMGRQMRDAIRGCRGPMSEGMGEMHGAMPWLGNLTHMRAGGLGGPGVIVKERVRKAGKGVQEIEITRRLPDGSKVIVKRTIKRDAKGVTVTGTRKRGDGKTIRFTESFREDPKGVFITKRTITDPDGRSHTVEKTVKKNGDVYEVTITRTGPDGKTRTVTREVEKKDGAMVMRFDAPCQGGRQMHTEIEHMTGGPMTIRRTVVDEQGKLRTQMTMMRDGACRKITVTGPEGQTTNITRNCGAATEQPKDKE